MITQTQSREFGGPLLKPHEKSSRPVGKKSALSGRIPIVALILFALALSVAFPYGLGLVVLVWGIALIGALFGVGFASVVLLKELFTKTASFGYAPTTAYMTGKKTRKKSKESPSHDAAEEQKDAG
jgi:hypothetical protein